MKLLRLSIILIYVTLFSCAKAPLEVDSGLPITISPSFESASRATTTAFEEGDQIGLYVLRSAENVKFVAAAGGSVTASPELYYPDPKQAVTLCAYYPYNSSVADATKIPFTVTADLKKSDLCYAQAKALPSAEAKALRFSHILSRVVVNVKLNSNIKNITSVKFINTATDFTFDINTGAITLKAQDKSLVINNSEAIVPPQTFTAGEKMLEITVETVAGATEVYYYTPLSATTLAQGKFHSFSLSINYDQSVTLTTAPLIAAWTSGASSGAIGRTVKNSFTAHSMIAHYNFAEVNRAVLSIKDGLTGTVSDFEAANLALVSGSTLSIASYTFNLEPVGVNYPYSVQSVKFYKATELIQEATTSAGSNVYKTGAFTLALSVAPTLSLSSSAPKETIPKAGETYYTNVTSNTTWSATATNAEVITTSTGNVTSFAITANSNNESSTRTVSVVFTTTTNAGQAAVSKTWEGTQEAGYFATPLPGFPNTYVAAKDNAKTDLYTTTSNCIKWGGRLPTKDELVAMYNNKSKYGNFGNNSYWSSTPYYNNSVYIVSFINGNVSHSGPYDANYYVRCVKDA